MLVAATVAGPVLVVFTSAMARTAVMTLALSAVPSLLAALGSMEVAVLSAMFVSEPLAGAATVTVKLVVKPATKFVIVGQITVPLLLVPPPEALTKVALVGNRSLTMTLVALLGPRFVTVRV